MRHVSMCVYASQKGPKPVTWDVWPPSILLPMSTHTSMKFLLISFLYECDCGYSESWSEQTVPHMCHIYMVSPRYECENGSSM